MKTNVNIRDYYNIINSMTNDEIKEKYGILTSNNRNKEYIIIARDRNNNSIFKCNLREYLEMKKNGKVKYIGKYLAI